MNAAAVACGLLLTGLAFALAFCEKRVIAEAAVLCAVVALISGSGPILDSDAAYAGCWISLLVVLGAVYWPQPLQRRGWPYWILAVNTGFWAGQVAATEALGRLLPALPALLLAAPAAWFVARGWTIAMRVVASWLFAVALLVGAIPHLVSHPGYVPDHRE